MTEREKRMADAARKFQQEMNKLGLGVSIKVGDGPEVRITDPPEPKQGKS